jgi:hypothetical protein
MGIDSISRLDRAQLDEEIPTGGDHLLVPEDRKNRFTIKAKMVSFSGFSK